MSTRQQWIEDRLRARKQRKGDLARYLGINNSRITEMIKGERRISAGEAERLGQFFGLAADAVLALIAGRPIATPSISLEAVAVLGYVKAGCFQDAQEMEGGPLYHVTVPVDERFARMNRFALEIRGDSMDELYPHGTLIVCVPLAELERWPVDGERVVVRRRNDQGDVEATVKQMRLADGRAWLVPRSSNPAHQALELPVPDFDDPWRHDTQAEIEIVALVIGSYRPE
jgi:SOS-response transcriptional repressor LexA